MYRKTPPLEAAFFVFCAQNSTFCLSGVHQVFRKPVYRRIQKFQDIALAEFQQSMVILV